MKGKMKCNKSQMATLTMWKIFMVLLLAMALLMPVTLARLHSTSGVGMSGGGSSMGPGGGGSGSGGISSKDSHGKSTSIPLSYYTFFVFLIILNGRGCRLQAAGSKPSPINKFKYLTNRHSDCEPLATCRVLPKKYRKELNSEEDGSLVEKL